MGEQIKNINTAVKGFKPLLAVFLFIAFIVSSASAQNNGTVTATATATANVIRGIAISSSGNSSLSFGQIVLTPVNQNRSVANNLGLKFLCTGEPGKMISVTYDNSVTLNNSAWVIQYGGSNGTLTFTPNTATHTGSSGTYSSPVPLTSGSSVTLPNLNGVGTLYLWVGGGVSIPANQPIGDYEGTFNINIAY
jgi:hypothetical protein